MASKMLSEKEWEPLPIVGEQPKDEKEKKYLKEICEYEFQNLEEPGLSIKFPYGDSRNRKLISLFHGGRYKVPRHIARHLENCTTPIWNWRPDGTGSMKKEMLGQKSRFQMREVYSQ